MGEVFDREVKRGMERAWRARVAKEGVKVKGRDLWGFGRSVQRLFWFLFGLGLAGILGLVVSVNGAFLMSYVGVAMGVFHYVMSSGRDTKELAPTPVSTDEMRAYTWGRVIWFWLLCFVFLGVTGWVGCGLDDVVWRGGFWVGYLVTFLAGVGGGLLVGPRRGVFKALFWFGVIFGMGVGVFDLKFLGEVGGNFVRVFWFSPWLVGEDSLWPGWLHWLVCVGLILGGLVRLFLDWSGWRFRRGEWTGGDYELEDVEVDPSWQTVDVVTREDVVSAFSKEHVPGGVVDGVLWRMLDGEQRRVWGALGWASFWTRLKYVVVIFGVWFLGGLLVREFGDWMLFKVMVGMGKMVGMWFCLGFGVGCLRLFMSDALGAPSVLGWFPVSGFSLLMGKVKELVLRCVLFVPFLVWAVRDVDSAVGVRLVGDVVYLYLLIWLVTFGVQVLVGSHYTLGAVFRFPLMGFGLLWLGALGMRGFYVLFTGGVLRRGYGGVGLWDWLFLGVSVVLVLGIGLRRMRDMGSDA